MVDGRQDEVRKTDQVISRIIELWPIWVMLLGGFVTAINFWNTVHALADEQKVWRITIEERRDKNRQELEEIRKRLTRLETDTDWLKKGGCK